jgi:hypothetical protein
MPPKRTKQKQHLSESSSSPSLIPPQDTTVTSSSNSHRLDASRIFLTLSSCECFSQSSSSSSTVSLRGPSCDMPMVLITIIAEYASSQWRLLVGVSLMSKGSPNLSIHILEPHNEQMLTMKTTEHKHGIENTPSMASQWHHIMSLNTETQLHMLGVVTNNQLLIQSPSNDGKIRLSLYDITKQSMSFLRLPSSSQPLAFEQYGSDTLVYCGRHPKLMDRIYCYHAWSHNMLSCIYLISINNLTWKDTPIATGDITEVKCPNYSWCNVVPPNRHEALRHRYTIFCQYEEYLYLFGWNFSRLDGVHVTTYNTLDNGNNRLSNGKCAWQTTTYKNDEANQMITNCHTRVFVIPSYGILFMSDIIPTRGANVSYLSANIIIFRPHDNGWHHVKWNLPSRNDGQLDDKHLKAATIQWWNNTIVIIINTRRQCDDSTSTLGPPHSEFMNERIRIDDASLSLQRPSKLANQIKREYAQQRLKALLATAGGSSQIPSGTIPAKPLATIGSARSPRPIGGASPSTPKPSSSSSPPPPRAITTTISRMKGKKPSSRKDALGASSTKSISPPSSYVTIGACYYLPHHMVYTNGIVMPEVIQADDWIHFTDLPIAADSFCNISYFS